MARSRRPLAALLALCLPLGACGGGGASAVRVRVPLSQDLDGRLAAERCVFDCRAQRGGQPSNYAECLSSCPGAEVTGGARCGAYDQAVWAACAESNHDLNGEVAEGGEGEGSQGGADAVGTGLAVVSLLADIASLASKKGGGKSGEGSSSKGSRSSGGGKGSASTSKGHASASPSKGHATASPSKGSSGHRAAKPSAK